ncbi:hypothetical protein EDC96DRAFT_531869 [Choanephora cucurbitarum]|nr:hypothetical protein EDC96DRAFT_531869 [Choanephora cucurbitarum]
MIQSKRPLPPTPGTNTKYKNDNNELLLDKNHGSLTDGERKWYNDIHKSIEQKDSIITNLKTVASEWKKKANEYETAYKETKRLFEEREKFLMKQHEAEIEATTKIQAEQLNESHELILQLEKENTFLRSQLNQFKYLEQSSIQTQSVNLNNDMYSQICHTAKRDSEVVSMHTPLSKENSNDLLQRINDMVTIVEGTLHRFENREAT